MLRQYLVICAITLLFHAARAQTYPFARLTGSPEMDTRGWNLVGDAGIGDTDGDTDNFRNEMILCNPVNFRSGACFYNQPVNISQCQKWVAEFDYRIFDGTGADGIAFCFLANPPTGFTVGGNIGIPERPQGLMIILDTYLNCPNSTPVPKLLIRYADGSISYGNNTESVLECPDPPQPTSLQIPLLRRPEYNRMKITYDSGNIRVFINETQYLSGRYPITFPGYFGFTSSTGGSNDRHSIRDFTLYTFKPIVSPPDAGPDQTVCSGDSVQLGTPPLPDDPYTYAWYPVSGLSNPAVANPKVRLFNDSPQPVTYTYFVTKDSLVNDSLCAFSDAVRITVLGKAAQAGFDFTVCSGETRQINGLVQAGYQYAWTPATGLSDSTIANPSVTLNNLSDAPVTYSYVLSATSLTNGCTTYDTLRVTVNPQLANAGPDLQFCSGESRQLGVAPLPGYNYAWLPATGLSTVASANPTLTLTSPTAAPQTFEYVLRAWNPGLNCTNTDTVRVTVFPQAVIAGPRSVCPNVTDVQYRISNPQPGISYQWTVQGGTIRSGEGSSLLIVDWGPANIQASVSVVASNAPDCPFVLPVIINRELIPERPAGTSPDSLCLAQARGIRYETVNTTGSVYTWGISANGTIVSGQGTHSVVVDWQDGGPGRLWVAETSTTRTDICTGVSDTLHVWIEPPPDPESVIITSVSTQTGADHTIVLRYRVQATSRLVNPLTISRRIILPEPGEWVTIATVPTSSNQYTDAGLATGENAYEYKIEGADACGERVTSVPHRSIRLLGNGDESEKSLQISWNPYVNWPQGVKYYEVWRKLDDEPDFTMTALISAGDPTALPADAREAFQHCYRIRAVEAGASGAFSWSNEVCLEFDHPLYIPNVITPDNDGKNDFWVIRNLELYRNHELTVVNRYGKVIFQTSNYQQNWQGENVSNGLYYYSLKTNRGNQLFSGWIQVLR